MNEYYVRSPDSENADGPFTQEQLRDLAASELIQIETLYCEEGMEDFAPFSENPDLWEQIKPAARQKLKLRLPNTPAPTGTEAKSKSNPTPPGADSLKATEIKPKARTKAAISKPEDESGNIGQMLAAAEGKTEQTRHIRHLKRSRALAVATLLPSVVLALLLSISVVVQPSWEAIFEMFKSGNYSIDLLTQNGILLFALADLFLAIGIGLGHTGLFPLLRFRCAIGLGFFFFLFYSRQEWLAVYAASALHVGVFAATLCVRFFATFFFSTLALAGGGALVWLVWFQGVSL